MKPEKIKKFAVIGNPIFHSKSPDIFNILFDKNKTKALYTRISSRNVKEAFELMKELDVCGVNVTMPYKSEVLAMTKAISNEVRFVQALNTIVKKDDVFYGFNTDIQGVLNPLITRGIKLSDQNVLVLGAGGAAKAVLFALNKKVKSITVCNRTEEKLGDLVRQFDCQIIGMDQLKIKIKQYSLIINATPVLKNFNITKNQILYNACYQNSKKSKSLKNGKKVVIDGKEWLIAQALESFQIFLNYKEKPEFNKEDLKKIFKIKQQPIAFIGFMGTGKSTVGEKLAKKIGYQWFDTDKIIEKYEKMSVVEIIKKKGMKYFREYEKNIVNQKKFSKETVISFGGGVVEDKENREFIKKNFQTIWIYTDISECLKRLKKNDRPLLNKKDKNKAAKTLFSKRKDWYYEVSDLIIRGNENVNKLVERIYEEIS